MTAIASNQCGLRLNPGGDAIIGWFSNRTGTSVDEGARKSNNWLDQWQSGKLGTGSRVWSFPRAFPSSTDVPVLLLNQPNMWVKFVVGSYPCRLGCLQSPFFFTSTERSARSFRSTDSKRGNARSLWLREILLWPSHFPTLARTFPNSNLINSGWRGITKRVCNA